MGILLYVLAALGAFIGIGMLVTAPRANPTVSEIEALLLLVISAILVSGGAIVQAIRWRRNDEALYAQGGSRGELPTPASLPASPRYSSGRNHSFGRLTPEEIAEADSAMTALGGYGYRLTTVRDHLWELAAPKGGTYFIYSLGQLKELVQRLGDGSAIPTVTPLESLSPEDALEAEKVLEALYSVGCPRVIKAGALWEITNRVGRVAYEVRTLEELRAVQAKY